MEAVYRRLSALYKSGQTQAVTQVRGVLVRILQGGCVEWPLLEVLAIFALRMAVKRETGILLDNLYCPRNGK